MRRLRIEGETYSLLVVNDLPNVEEVSRNMRDVC